MTGRPSNRTTRDGHRGLATALLLAASVLAGCSPSPHTPTGPAPSQGAATTSPASASAAVATAEAVQQKLGNQLSADEDHFGSGTGSPCATSSAKALTPACGAAVEAAGADARSALRQIHGHHGFAALRTTATHVAAARYDALRCASAPTAPTAPATRQTCLTQAATAAQAFDDLRDGINLGLDGR